MTIMILCVDSIGLTIKSSESLRLITARRDHLGHSDFWNSMRDASAAHKGVTNRCPVAPVPLPNCRRDEMRTRILMLALATAVLSPVHSEEEPRYPPSIKCSFKKSAFLSYVDGKIDAKLSADPLDFILSTLECACAFRPSYSLGAERGLPDTCL